jgi:hypothetical protein
VAYRLEICDLSRGCHGIGRKEEAIASSKPEIISRETAGQQMKESVYCVQSNS